jgi:hypothetical protein
VDSLEKPKLSTMNATGYAKTDSRLSIEARTSKFSDNARFVMARHPWRLLLRPHRADCKPSHGLVRAVVAPPARRSHRDPGLESMQSRQIFCKSIESWGVAPLFAFCDKFVNGPK